ncbi:hypothetical protein HETIRDRAFT_440611 [Heterobasidion irregulare TC 32-1]|uniref:Uncharacterized protein n=1 Tax=Heterobasidion irregulare (strain TC 32-1) TaxID=747525 RepID=W4K6W1_HETIT|nr:uncharacterized protein HETIRDRAFT_440611 [Heterobasidion irregulare TC 32-1]ETW81085.1 hypothetical protein HETIRDRAFT_440611 [Heterobasidion irregulare TC 32-1]
MLQTLDTMTCTSFTSPAVTLQSAPRPAHRIVERSSTHQTIHEAIKNCSRIIDLLSPKRIPECKEETRRNKCRSTGNQNKVGFWDYGFQYVRKTVNRIGHEVNSFRCLR